MEKQKTTQKRKIVNIDASGITLSRKAIHEKVRQDGMLMHANATKLLKHSVDECFTSDEIDNVIGRYTNGIIERAKGYAQGAHRTAINDEDVKNAIYDAGTCSLNKIITPRY